MEEQREESMKEFENFGILYYDQQLQNCTNNLVLEQKLNLQISYLREVIGYLFIIANSML